MRRVYFEYAFLCLKNPHRFLTVFPMKNIFQITGGKWRFEIQENGKLTRKTFSSKAEALGFKNTFFAARKLDLSYFAALSGEQIKDIKDAIAALPQGKTLLQSVQKAWKYFSEQNLIELADKFFEIKKNKYETGKLSHDEFTHIKGRLANFKKNFPTFADLSPEKLLSYLKSKGANKTIANWRGTISELLEFCISRGAIASNPIRFIHGDELLVGGEAVREIGFVSVDTAKKFLAFLEAEYPQYVRFYALTMFAGVRVAEAPRLKDEYFRYEEKKIIFPAKIGKIKKSWTLEDLPENLWVWLEKYKNRPILRPSNTLRTKFGDNWNLPENFTRHSFATYHLSLYLDPRRTSMITRNSEQMLRNHYWAALVDKETAKAYFAILPK